MKYMHSCGVELVEILFKSGHRVTFQSHVSCRDVISTLSLTYSFDECDMLLSDRLGKVQPAQSLKSCVGDVKIVFIAPRSRKSTQNVIRCPNCCQTLTHLQSLLIGTDEGMVKGAAKLWTWSFSETDQNTKSNSCNNQSVARQAHDSILSRPKVTKSSKSVHFKDQ